MARDTRQRMVLSAGSVLRRNGVNGTSFARVLEHSGAPRGSIAYHFPGGKKEMILAAVEASGTEIADRLQKIVDDGVSAADFAAAICSYFADGLERSSFRAGCPVAAVAHEAYDDPELSTAARDAVACWTELLAEVLRRDGAEKDRARRLATFAIGSVEGALMLARLQGTREPLDVAAQFLKVTLAAPT